MTSFGKRVKECRELKKISQNELAKLIDTHHSMIGKYERDDVKPSIDVVKKIAEVLSTTVGYLVGETNDSESIKDSAMLKRINDVMSFSEKEQDYILYTLDSMIAATKLKKI